MMFDNPSLLALLVNESRAENIERSGDIYSRNWIEPKYQYSVSSLWNEFAEDVYNQDDIVLSVRNRIIKGVLEKEIDSNTVVLLMPCGLVSYPFSLNENAEYIEMDMPDLINYKLAVAKKNQDSGVFPKRKIKYVAADICSHEDTKALLANISGNKKRIFILEGISYYLNEQKWWGIVDDVLSACSHGDVIVFDYWPYEERSIDIYDRFRRFCNKHMTTQIDSFLFLKKSEILSRLSTTGVIHIESVISGENQYINTHLLRENNILNDTCAIVTIK